MRRLFALAALACLVPALAAAQVTPASTASAKIASAMTAAPSSISANATIMDYPSTPTGQPTQLRAGTNGWTCFPEMTAPMAAPPMCLDQQWMSWGHAWMSHTAPHITALGVGYMLHGTGEGSNTDPYAEHRTADNEWGVDPPHMMVVSPDPHAFDAMPTDRNNGGPWVMYRGTPYVHLMVPVQNKP